MGWRERQGNIALEGSEQSHVQADISNVDAGTIMRALRLPYMAATRVNGKLQAEWPGLDYLQAKGTADATLRPTASEMSRSAMPVGGRMVARGNGGRIDAQLVRLPCPAVRSTDGRRHERPSAARRHQRARG